LGRPVKLEKKREGQPRRKQEKARSPWGGGISKLEENWKKKMGRVRGGTKSIQRKKGKRRFRPRTKEDRHKKELLPRT